MNQELIDMAKKVGIFVGDGPEWDFFKRQYAKFAAIVAAAEREACAKVCENSAGIIDAPNAFINGPSNSATRKAQCFADAIRARGEKK